MNFSGYDQVELIARGGMAAVYRARQKSLDRPVAIKVLSRSVADIPAVRERFDRESLIIAGLSHANIVHVFDRGYIKDGMPYFVMEYAQGKSLKRLIAEGGLSTTRKLYILIQCARALAYAHENRIIHSDIKPANVMVDAKGLARVVDFGISELFGELAAGSEGLLAGTPAYMAPERMGENAANTPLSDIYSLGVVMYELFAGVKPAEGIALCRKAKGVPDAVCTLVDQCLARDPALRPRSAIEIRDRLLRVLSGAHLNREQVEKAGRDITEIKKEFNLLDVIKETPRGSVYLFEKASSGALLVIKKYPFDEAAYRAARILSTHPQKNIARIHGVSRNPRVFIQVLEYLSGGSLQERLVQPYGLAEFLETAIQVCRGLQHAHRNRLVHANLRPGNILFDRNGVVKLTDFGLPPHGPGGKKGGYPPRDEVVTGRTDVYGAGVVFYQMITLKLPHRQDLLMQTDRRFADLPRALKRLLTDMLAEDPEKRPAGFGEVLASLEPLHDGNVKRAVASGALGDGESPRHGMRWALLVFVLLCMITAASFYLAAL